MEILEQEVQGILSKRELSVTARLQAICDLLRAKVAYYDWVGFYFRNGDRDELKLGPYSGDPTEHTLIPFGKGICGQVAISGRNFVVPDVSSQDNYIACSLTVRAEIVVPLFLDGRNVGQIDIDSHQINPFTPADERFLEHINAQIGHVLAETV